MPKDHVTKNPRGFAFVGFENKEIVTTVTKDRYHQINGKTVEVKGCDDQENYQNQRRDYKRNSDHHQQQIQTVVPSVQTIQTVPQQTIQYQLPQQLQGLQGQLQGLAQQQQPQIGAGYTVIPAGYSYDPATGIIYQAALPQQTAAAIPGAAGLAAAGQLSQIGTLGALPQAYLQAGIQQQQVAVSQAPVASSYQPIALGQYQHDASAFGAQRAAIPVQGALPSVVQQLQPSQDSQQFQGNQGTDNGHQQQDRNNQRSFHPYGR